jgi:uncharacterized membrane protein
MVHEEVKGVIMAQKWYQSKVAWVSILALLYFVVKTWFGFDIPGWDTFVSLLIAAVAAFGVFNNPSNATGFGANQ